MPVPVIECGLLAVVVVVVVVVVEPVPVRCGLLFVVVVVVVEPVPVIVLRAVAGGLGAGEMCSKAFSSSILSSSIRSSWMFKSLIPRSSSSGSDILHLLFQWTEAFIPVAFYIGEWKS